MSDSFIPLSPATAATGGGTNFRLKVVPPSAGPASSQPRSALSTHTAHTAEPTVTLQRDGDRVTGLRLHCTCGQVIDLAFTL